MVGDGRITPYKRRLENWRRERRLPFGHFKGHHQIGTYLADVARIVKEIQEYIESA